jgi:ABC-2 type transport system permease protein
MEKIIKMGAINWTGMYTLVRVEVERIWRVIVQVLVAPLITALLYIFVFGSVVGSRIESINGIAYIDFALPGILMLSLIGTAFAQSSTSLYFKRFARHIEELLVAPIANGTIILSFVLGSVIRGLMVGIGVLLIAVFFGAANITHFGWFLFYTIGVASLFGFLGIIIGLWAKGFEQLNVLSIFFITPLTFLGGVFYSITMLPEAMQKIIVWNPFFYFVDGIRYAMIGHAEASIIVGASFVVLTNVLLFGVVWYLFKVGYGVRE